MYENCDIHYLTSDLPGPLPPLEAIKASKRTFRLSQTGLKVVQVGEHYVVKSGPVKHLPFLEAWAAVFLQKSTSIIVPTVHVMFTDKTANENYIIMEYVRGRELEKIWGGLEDQDKENIASQLKDYFAEMRALPAPGGFERTVAPGFGNLGRVEFIDLLFHSRPDVELETEYTFNTIREFGEYIVKALTLSHDDYPEVPKYYRRLIEAVLPEGRPVFTHGDLQLKNIILRDDNKVVLIDWGMAGWYPDFWEYSIVNISLGLVKTDWHAWIHKFMPEYIPEALLVNDMRWVQLKGR